MKEIKEKIIEQENINRFLDKFNLEVRDSGEFYEIDFISKKTGDKIIVAPVIKSKWVSK